MKDPKTLTAGNSRRQFLSNISKAVLISSVAALPGGVISASAISKGKVGKDEDDLKQIKEWIENKEKPLKWIFTGDSITQGAKHTLGYRSYPEIFSERIRFEMNRGRDLVINTAISGNATRDILDDFDWRIAQFNPQVISLMIGTNDAAAIRNISINTFETNLRALVEKFRQLHAIPILHTPNIIATAENSDKERLTLPQYVNVIRKVAHDFHVILVDHWKYWEENREKVLNERWRNDPLHPNGRGHLEMARLLFKTLSIFDDSSFTCTGTINF
jgi:lysophospholipase L1-like esterase